MQLPPSPVTSFSCPWKGAKQVAVTHGDPPRKLPPRICCLPITANRAERDLQSKENLTSSGLLCYSVDYPELSFPLCFPRGPSHCVSFHEDLPQKEEKFKPTLLSPFQRPRRRCGDFFQGRVCMSQILPSVAREFGFGFFLNPTLELEALVASTIFPVKCLLWVTAGMLGTWQRGRWPGLASLLWLDSHWHFLPVVGIDWHPAPHTLSVYLGGI